jgi:hypothetical protein
MESERLRTDYYKPLPQNDSLPMRNNIISTHIGKLNNRPYVRPLCLLCLTVFSRSNSNILR